jgi:hypothetical protein
VSKGPELGGSGMAGFGGRQTGGFQGRARDSCRSIQQRHRGQRLRPRGTPFIVACGKPPGVVFNEEHSVSRRFISEVKIVAHDDTSREVARCVVGQPVVSHCCKQASSALSCDLKSWPMRDFDSTLRCLLQRSPKMRDFGTDLGGQTFWRQRAREERDDGTVLHAARLHRRAKVRNRELSRDLGGPLLGASRLSAPGSALPTANVATWWTADIAGAAAIVRLAVSGPVLLRLQ